MILTLVAALAEIGAVIPDEEFGAAVVAPPYDELNVGVAITTEVERLLLGFGKPVEEYEVAFTIGPPGFVPLGKGAPVLLLLFMAHTVVLFAGNGSLPRPDPEPG